MRGILFSIFLALFLIIFELSRVFSAGDIRSSIFIGSKFINQSSKSPLTNSQIKYASTISGYDGQFFYYIALDPINARYYIDNPPSYRYGRIIYPILAKLLSLGNSKNIPYALVLINVLAILGSVYVLSLWLIEHKLSPLYSLAYGIYPGLHIALQRDLSEPLAYFFTIAAIYLLNKSKLVWSILLFTASALTRESTLIFPLIYGLSYLLEARHRQKGLALLLIPLAFYLFYKLLLSFWLGSPGGFGDVMPPLFPFFGLSSLPLEGYAHDSQIYGVVIPGTIAGIIAAYHLVWEKYSKEAFIVLISSLLFVVFLNSNSYLEYTASGRISVGLVLAFLFFFPALGKKEKKATFLAVLAIILWSLTWLLIPTFPKLA